LREEQERLRVGEFKSLDLRVAGIGRRGDIIVQQGWVAGSPYWAKSAGVACVVYRAEEVLDVFLEDPIEPKPPLT